jgi:2-oxoglutarate ferredoxin oxidoreductase subunit gamma
MAFRYEVRISGTGGQGIILAAIILAEAATLKGRGQKIVQTVHYGPQVRGGLSNAELVISDEEIDYPLPLGLDLLIPFTQQAMEESAHLMKQRGIIIHDPSLVPKAWQGWLADIPLTQLAQNTTGKKQMANIVALGAVSVLCPHVDPKVIAAALKARAPEGIAETFLKASSAGRKAARSIKEQMYFEEIASLED